MLNLRVLFLFSIIIIYLLKRFMRNVIYIIYNNDYTYSKLIGELTNIME